MGFPRKDKENKWLLVACGFLGIAMVGGLAKASSPTKLRLQQLITLTGQIRPLQEVVYRGDLLLVMSSDKKEIRQLRYVETSRNPISGGTESFTADIELSSAKAGATLMEFNSHAAITIKADQLNSRTGGSVALILTREHRKSKIDDRALHLKLSRTCETCDFSIDLDENGEKGSAAHMRLIIDADASGIKAVAVTRPGGLSPLSFDTELDLTPIFR